MELTKQPVKGMRDILPNEMQVREYVLDLILKTYRSFGFMQIKTPSVEHIDNLLSKQGGDNEKLIFKILNRGEKLNLQSENEKDFSDSGLRYDLTLPLSRFFSNNEQVLNRPLKSIQIGDVWRADRPQKGRYRQFTQCDIDILGEQTTLAEIELISAINTFLTKLNAFNFKIVINDRRLLKDIALYSGFDASHLGEVFIVLDKYDKIGIDGVVGELVELGFDKEVVDKYMKIVQDAKNDINTLDNIVGDFEYYKDFISLIDIVKQINPTLNLEFFPYLVRGMDYYTGTIFEIVADGLNVSIGGGGRYDNMIGGFGGLNTPACGFSIGFERLIFILMENNFIVPSKQDKIAILFDKANMSDAKIIEIFKNANKLRESGHEVYVSKMNKNLKNQIENLQKLGYFDVQKITE